MSTIQPDLDPIRPGEAQTLYLKHKATDCTEKTVQAHRYRTNHFVRWCGENDVTDLDEMIGRHPKEYRFLQKEDGGLNQLTLNQQMNTMRVVLTWCGSVEAVPPTLYDNLLSPRGKPDQQRREETLHSDDAATILEYISTFHYASIELALRALLWETGIRLGSAHAAHVSDVDLQDNRLQLAHRPDRGTGLKTGSEGERVIAIRPELASESVIGKVSRSGRSTLQSPHAPAWCPFRLVSRHHRNGVQSGIALEVRSNDTLRRPVRRTSAFARVRPRHPSHDGRGTGSGVGRSVTAESSVARMTYPTASVAPS